MDMYWGRGWVGMHVRDGTWDTGWGTGGFMYV